MSNSTSISDLPLNPLNGGNISNGGGGGGGGGNVTVNENISTTSGTINLDQSTISQIVNGLQQASNSGATQLPSRDISMSTTNITNDLQVQPNYIPSTNKDDYIEKSENKNEMINNYNINMQRNNSLDEMYNEIQTPLLIAVLYFLFQLPIFKKMLYSYFPILFSTDGNLNINGFIFNSIIFGFIFYVLDKITVKFNTF
jgi:hypothetical protein